MPTRLRAERCLDGATTNVRPPRALTLRRIDERLELIARDDPRRGESLYPAGHSVGGDWDEHPPIASPLTKPPAVRLARTERCLAGRPASDDYTPRSKPSPR